MAVSYLEYQVPFCRPFNCSAHSVRTTTDFQLWACLPNYCRINLVVLMAFTVLLAVMTVACNVIILAINFSSKTVRIRKRNPTMNNYSVYVLSLAVADLLVGLVVLPLCLFNFYEEFLMNNDFAINVLSNDVHVNNINATESPPGETPKSDDLVELETKIKISEPSNTVYLQLLGVFTHLTLFVSIYTLIAASSDRLYAAKYSVLYVNPEITKKTGLETGTSWIVRKWRTTRRSSIAVGLVWTVGVLFALAPYFFNKRVYFRQVGHIFSAMTSTSSYSTIINWYLATLILPLVGIWVLNVLICTTLWRRKAQLGVQRRRSLRRESIPDVSGKPNVHIMQDKKNNIQQGKRIYKKPNPHEIMENSSSSKLSRVESNNHKKQDSRIYNKSTSLHDASSRQHTWSRHPDNKSSLLRRRVSSLRRAKEMVQLRSSESSITKTLCMVVIAFTVAVLPLVVSLSKITKTANVDAQVLNKEVTALTVSLLFLFSNSVVNCVIYGARMRDFRSSFKENIRAFGDKIKNALCCCCFQRSDKHSSEIVSGVFFVSSKHQRSEVSDKSSRHFASSTLDRMRHVARRSSKKSSDMKSPPESHERSSRDSYEFQSPALSPIAKTSINKVDRKVPRPSSSGYRTDPELPSIPDEHGRKRLSEKSDVGDIIEESEVEEHSSNHDLDLATSIRPASLLLPDYNVIRTQSSTVKLRGNAEERGSRETRPMSTIPTSLNEARKISSGAAEDYTLLFDYKNHRDSRIVTPSDVSLDIDFTQFSIR